MSATQTAESSLYGGGGPWNVPGFGHGAGGSGTVNIGNSSALTGPAGSAGIVMVEEYS